MSLTEDRNTSPNLPHCVGLRESVTCLEGLSPRPLGSQEFPKFLSFSFTDSTNCRNQDVRSQRASPHLLAVPISFGSVTPHGRWVCPSPGDKAPCCEHSIFGPITAFIACWVASVEEVERDVKLKDESPCGVGETPGPHQACCSQGFFPKGPVITALLFNY